jgi:phosphoglycolate phosphatase
MKKSLMFDLDGTLVDSEPGIVASCRAAIGTLGYELEPTYDLAAMIGPPVEDVMRHLLARYDDDRVSEAVKAYREHYGAVGLFECAVYADISEALDALLSAGVTLYVATSKRTHFACRILERSGLANRFTGVYGSEPGGGLDHKPELLSHLLKREGIAAENAVMVGDRHFDIVGAHANNMRAVGVLWGYGDREELETAAADRLVERPGEIKSAAMDLLAI